MTEASRVMMAPGGARLGARLPLRGFVAALALACVVLLAVASGAQAYVYWTDFAAGSIGRANLDGSGVNQNFITGLPGPGQVAVDHAHVYWTNGYSIGRANLDGSGKNVNFIQGLSWGAGGVAVYHVKRKANCEDVELVWTNSLDVAVAHATAPGCSCQSSVPCVTTNFIPGIANTLPLNIAIDGQDYVDTASGHVYWTYFSGTNLTSSIGRANLDGTGVNQSFITTAANHTPDGVAVDSGHVYWTNTGIRDLFPGSIGRANLDGTDVNQNFITGASQPESVAVDGAHVYWDNHDSNSIGRANLDGSGVNQNFITGAAEPWGVAVDAGGPSPVLAPRLADVTQSAPSWRVGSLLPRAAGRKPPVGTTFGFTLDRAARVRFVFAYRTLGRRVAGKCVAQTNANRSRARCLRTVRAAFSRRAHAGRTRLRFQGRLARKRTLPPGRYKLLITATANGHRSKPAILRFTILP